MLALIPYFEIPVYELAPGLVIDSWAVLVAVAFIVGLEVARARGIRLGLEVKDIVDGTVFTVAMGFFIGHQVHILAYNRHIFEEEGIVSLLKFWAGFSSMGGFLGAVIGCVLFYTVIRKRDFWKHADCIAYGLPFGWVFGRLACFTAHDHIGRQSEFFLAVDFPGIGPRHDLGLYEAMWAAVIAAIFWARRNKPFKPGTHVAMLAMLYGPIRVVLDFLRNYDLPGADTRYAGLTFAQYGAITMTIAGAAVLVWMRKADLPVIDPKAEPPPPEGPEEEAEADSATG